MLASELINKVQELIDKHGDKEITVYKSFTKETSTFSEVTYDESINDIYIGIYA